jgi:nucleoside-diphosphate-sugar epimerase
VKKKRILVTGAEGFIGRRLVTALDEKGFEVVPLTKKDGDIATLAIDAQEIDHVFHLAAKTFVPDSWVHPADFYRTNVMGTLQVLEFCRKSKCGLTFNSTYVYGRQDKMPIGEDARLQAPSPYHQSKILAEDLCRFYAEKNNVNVTILRPFNIYGPGQKDTFLIPKLVQQVTDTTNESVEVLDLAPKRDYLHVDDLIAALLLTIETKGFAIYNVGSGTSLSVADVIEKMFSVSGGRKKVVSRKVERPAEIPEAVADISKITQEIKWHPAISFEQGIQQLISTNEKD